MFEVGKKYRHKKDPVTIYKVLHVGQHRTFVTFENDDVSISNRFFSEYEEYKEPVVHKRYIHWFKTKNDKVWTMSSTGPGNPLSSNTLATSYLGTTEVEFTETENV